MINLRYHIVSLTAVFLALGIGVLLGGTYLDKYTVDQLDQSITSAEQRIRETSAENDRLRGEIGDAEARNRSLLDLGTTQLFHDQLTDVPVVIVASEGTDETARRNLVRALDNSGADFRGTLTVTGRLLEDDQVALVGERLEIGDATPSEARAEAIARFGEALAVAGAQTAPTVPGDAGEGGQGGEGGDGGEATTTTLPGDATVAPTTEPGVAPGDPTTTTTTPPPETPVAPPEQPEIVSVLLDVGVLSLETPGEQPEARPLLTQPGHRYVFLSGPEPAIDDAAFLIPVLRTMAEIGPVPVVMASGDTDTDPDNDDRDEAVASVRTDAELSRLVSTVDNLEAFNGIASTVLALDEVGRGTRGHYGEGRGAAAPLPSGT